MWCTIIWFQVSFGSTDPLYNTRRSSCDHLVHIFRWNILFTLEYTYLKNPLQSLLSECWQSFKGSQTFSTQKAHILNKHHKVSDLTFHILLMYCYKLLLREWKAELASVGFDVKTHRVGTNAANILHRNVFAILQICHSILGIYCLSSDISISITILYCCCIIKKMILYLRWVLILSIYE